MNPFLVEQIVITVISYWIIPTLGSTSSNCTGWKLVGGRRNYEGLVAVSYKNLTVNICKGFSTNALDLCKYLNYSSTKTIGILLDTNAFETSLSNNSINVTSCNGFVTLPFYETCRKGNESAECCSAVSLCCADKSDYRGQCSTNWTEAVTNSKPGDLVQVTAKTVHKIEYSKHDEYWNVSLSWTASALKDMSSGGNTHSSDTDLRNCQLDSGCLDLTDLHISLKNETCKCLEGNSNVATTYYRVVDNYIANVTLCIAARVEEGRPVLFVEDCGTLLPWFVVKRYMMPTTTSVPKPVPTPVPTTPRGKEESRSADSSYNSSTSSDGSTSMIFSLSLTLGVLGCLVCIIPFVVWMCKKRRKSKPERQRPNSLANRTYGHEILRQTDDEEYTVIIDISDGRDTVTYKPPLPGRSRSQDQDTQDTNIITLDDYSSPSDMMTEDFQGHDADDYSTTYDDPIRHHSLKTDIKETGVNVKGKHIDIETELRDKESYLEKENDSAISKVSDIGSEAVWQKNVENSEEVNDFEIEKDKRNKDQIDCSSSSNNLCNISSDCNIRQSIVVQDKITEASIKLNADIDSLKTSVNFDESSSGKPASASEKVSGEADSDYEDTDIIDGIFPNKSKSRNSDSSDYEDTDLIDGKHPAKPELIFPTHVCLDCLAPEHLKKLGISIISDDNYCGSHGNLKSTLSEPKRHSYCNTEYLNVNLDEEDATVTVERCDESGMNIKPTRFHHTDRKCSVCHTIYDTLGKVKRKQWKGVPDNEYDKICNTEHFQQRHLPKKRIKSS